MNSLKKIVPLLLLLVVACEQKPKTKIPNWIPYDETEEITANEEHPSVRMRYKLIQSKVSDKNEMLDAIEAQLGYFSEEDYVKYKSLILNKDIPTIQASIEKGELNYELLTKWYLYRIGKFESDKNTALHNIISINPDAVSDAKEKDAADAGNRHPIYGIPVLLKDNINFKGIPTTAGAEVLKNNYTEKNAFITNKIREHGGIILGKTNLSEWANYLCIINPNGYSAVGGQTLNPYGRKVFDTGGSSSGSGSAVAANYSAVAVGTETSGSILSPSSSNSLVGLKPTIGLLSRSGIVPISSTLDTPGPMTRSVIDNAILLSAMTGYDRQDAASAKKEEDDYLSELSSNNIEGLRFGAFIPFMSDTLYAQAIENIKSLGGEVVEITPEQMSFDGFLSVLNLDMKVDLPEYLEDYASEQVKVTSVADIINYNNQDTLVRIPYGQGRFEGIEADTLTQEQLLAIKERLNADGANYFAKPMKKHQLDMMLSINNWTAGQAAAAKYPCLTVPMGYDSIGTPMGITFVSRPFEEHRLLKVGHTFEQNTQVRKDLDTFE